MGFRWPRNQVRNRTLSWRKADSNSWSHRERSGHGRAPRTNHRHRARAHLIVPASLFDSTWDRGFESPLLHRRVRCEPDFRLAPTSVLNRSAFVYIRQSTADQLLHNPESRRRQYGLADRARQLGWTTVKVIDDDLGRSGGGINRPGFERLLAAICEGRVGGVFAVEASRLASNGRDWHTLIEFCGLVGTVIVDEDGNL